MSEKEEPDFSNLNKYFIDDTEIKKTEIPKKNIITEKANINDYSSGFYRKEKEILTHKVTYKIEKHGSKAKKEFLAELNDESLSLDIASNVSKDWGKK